MPLNTCLVADYMGNTISSCVLLVGFSQTFFTCLATFISLIFEACQQLGETGNLLFITPQMSVLQNEKKHYNSGN